MSGDKTPGGRDGRESDTGVPPAGDDPRVVLEIEQRHADGTQIRISVVVHGELPPEAQQLLEEMVDGLRDEWEQNR